MKTLLLATAALLGAATMAHAAITPALTSVTAEGDLFRFTYQGSLDGDTGVVNGSKLVIYDFAGFAGGFQVPNANIVASTEFSSGFFAPGHTDDPTILNLVFTWTGPAFNASGGPFSAVDFEGLSALSTFGGTTTDGFASLGVKNNEATGTLAYAAGSVMTPFAAVPEPATWGLMIVGFGGVGGLMRKRGPALAAA